MLIIALKLAPSEAINDAGKLKYSPCLVVSVLCLHTPAKDIYFQLQEGDYKEGNA